MHNICPVFIIDAARIREIRPERTQNGAAELDGSFSKGVIRKMAIPDVEGRQMLFGMYAMIDGGSALFYSCRHACKDLPVRHRKLSFRVGPRALVGQGYFDPPCRLTPSRVI
jgi:hypothetical protein